MIKFIESTAQNVKRNVWKCEKHARTKLVAHIWCENEFTSFLCAFISEDIPRKMQNWANWSPKNAKNQTRRRINQMGYQFIYWLIPRQICTNVNVFIIVIVRLCVSFYSHPLHLPPPSQVILQGIDKLTLDIKIFWKSGFIKGRNVKYLGPTKWQSTFPILYTCELYDRRHICIRFLHAVMFVQIEASVPSVTDGTQVASLAKSHNEKWERKTCEFHGEFIKRTKIVVFSYVMHCSQVQVCLLASSVRWGQQGPPKHYKQPQVHPVMKYDTCNRDLLVNI